MVWQWLSKFKTLRADGFRLSRLALWTGLCLLLNALDAPVWAGEVQQVGLTSVPPGAGPFHYETAEQKDVRVDIVARDITHGYSVLFLPNGDALIVERGLSLRLLRGATGMSPELVATPVANVPEFSKVENLHPDDVLGIQDVALHPDFAANGLIYFTYNKPVSYDAVAKRLNTVSVLGRAKFDGMKLSNARDLLVGETVIGTGGSRILFGPGKTLYISIGALSTGDIDSAQRTDNIYGKVLRINTDGSIPADNPFAKVKGARPEIWTYGHRDPLGLAIDPRSGSVVASEHGPQGGDELNVLLPGRNYGWPKYSYGTEYAGSPLPAMPVGADTVGPIVTWLPAVAPNGIAFYTGDAIPAWKNNLFIASARRGQINGTGALLRVVFNDKLQEMRQESLLDDLHQRFKDVRQGPDGMLYALTDENSSVLLRISPASRPVR